MCAQWSDQRVDKRIAIVICTRKIDVVWFARACIIIERWKQSGGRVNKRLSIFYNRWKFKVKCLSRRYSTYCRVIAKNISDRIVSTAALPNDIVSFRIIVNVV